VTAFCFCGYEITASTAAEHAEHARLLRWYWRGALLGHLRVRIEALTWHAERKRLAAAHFAPRRASPPPRRRA
jgi:hypothetical protein